MSDVPPEEIIGEILIRLPVKSLLRFRCVSKPWRSMIDSKHFTKLHLHHSYNTSSNRTLVVDSVELFYVDLDAFQRLDIGDNQFKPDSVVCSCDGLVLLAFELDNVVLWNPATRKFNKLPDTPLDCQVPDEGIYVDLAYALGYDSKNDDYKVVRLIQVRTRPNGWRVSSEAKVFSLKSNTWKRIGDFPYMLSCCTKWGAYLNDTLHTVLKEGDEQSQSEVIMGFNIAKEEHFEVPKPCTNSGLTFVVVMGGYLTAIDTGDSINSEIWVMKEYGVKESWTKLFCFQLPIGDRNINAAPLAYSKSGDAVLFSYGGACLYSYDLRNKTVSTVCIPGFSDSFNASEHDLLFRAEFCVGSLVSPYSPAGTEYELKPKKGKEIKRKWSSLISLSSYYLLISSLLSYLYVLNDAPSMFVGTILC